MKLVSFRTDRPYARLFVRTFSSFLRARERPLTSSTNFVRRAVAAALAYSVARDIATAPVPHLACLQPAARLLSSRAELTLLLLAAAALPLVPTQPVLGPLLSRRPLASCATHAFAASLES